jgi:hypothetical protein
MAKTKTATPPSTAPSSAPPNLGAWQRRTLHTITCPSGQRLRIRIPGIATLLEHGDVPDDLVELALLELSEESGATGALAGELATATESDDAETRERVLGKLKDYGKLQRLLAVESIQFVELEADDPQAHDVMGEDGARWLRVKLTIADTYSDLPEDDLAMVAEIAQRLRLYDARGVRIGVEPLDRWTSFREAHGCPDEDCRGCQALIEQFSAAHVGAV